MSDRYVAQWKNAKNFKATQFTNVQIKLTDGNILNDAIPQYNGEFYWSPVGLGEYFIMPDFVDCWRELKEEES